MKNGVGKKPERGNWIKADYRGGGEKKGPYVGSDENQLGSAHLDGNKEKILPKERNDART